MKRPKPNLQNIPIRTEEARKIRDAIKRPVWPDAADYESIEKKILEKIEKATPGA